MNTLTTTKQNDLFKLQDMDFDRALEMATKLANANLIPKDYKNRPADMILAWQLGAELGLTPMASLQHIAVVNGRTCIWGDAALALCMNSPSFEDIQESLTYDENGNLLGAICKIKRKGRSVVEVEFTVQDAINADLWDKSYSNGQPSIWKKYPKRMLPMRARGFALRNCFADVLTGLIIREEAEDYDYDIIPEPKTEESKSSVSRLKGALSKSADLSNSKVILSELLHKGSEISAVKTEEIINEQKPIINEQSEEIIEDDSKKPFDMNKIGRLIQQYETEFSVTSERIAKALNYESVFMMTKDDYLKLVELGPKFRDGSMAPEVYFY